MTHDELSIDFKAENGGGRVFRFRGSMDIATSPAARGALSEAIDGGANNLIVDMRQLEFLDSTGLGVLIGAHRRAAEKGGSLRIIVSDGPILRLLNITGLISIFGAYHSLDDARNDRNRLTASF